MTSDPKFQEIEAKKAERTKLASRAAQIEADLNERSARADETTADVEAAEERLRAAKLAQVINPSKEGAAAVADCQKAVKTARTAEQGEMQDEDVYRAALRKLNADVAQLDEEIKKLEFRRLVDILKAHDPGIAPPLARLLAPTVLLYRLGGGGGSEPDWGHFIPRYIKSDLLHDEVLALKARLMAGEVLP